MPARLSLAALILPALIMAPAAPARADMGPVIVIPSRPGVPTVINGRNANYAVVEGDWGLARPGHMAPRVIGGTLLGPTRAYAPRRPYYPSLGAVPLTGRHEIEPGPNRIRPELAEPYSRSWGTAPSAGLPPTIREPGVVDPGIVVVPQIRGRPR